MFKPLLMTGILTISAMAITTMGLPAWSQENPTSPPILMSGGIIYDTLEQAREFASNWKTPTFRGVPGCGFLQGRAVGTVTMMEPLETSTNVYPMARYDFTAGPLKGQTQYGWFGRPTTKTAEVAI